MPFRILFAAPLLLLLLSTDARAARVDPSSKFGLPVDLNLPIKANGLITGPLGSLQPADSPGLNRDHGGPLFLRALAPPIGPSRSGNLQLVLDAIWRQGGAAFAPHGSEMQFPFQYRDYLRIIQLERRNPRRGPVSSSVVVLPLPASGWLLGTAVLGCLLLGKRRRRASRRQRQPLRYSTV